MPMNNKLFGVYKTLMIGGKFILVSNATRTTSMQNQIKTYVQGTPKARIMDLGGLTEEFNISAPMLIGGAENIDGKSLIAARLADILSNPAAATLPVLKSASLSVNQQGATTDIVLKSDGNPANSNVFEVTDYSATYLTDGTNTDVLNPLLSGGPTRLARFYDFRVAIGGKLYYVLEAKVQVEVDTTDVYFIPGNDGSTSNGNPINISTGAGLPYPTIGVTGIRISGSGKAAVLLNNSTGSDYYFTDYADYDAVNEPIGTGKSPVTVQSPGLVNVVSPNFSLQIYNGSTWVDLLDSAVVDLSKSVVTRDAFRVETGLLTTDFTFNCWVK